LTSVDIGSVGLNLTFVWETSRQIQKVKTKMEVALACARGTPDVLRRLMTPEQVNESPVSAHSSYLYGDYIIRPGYSPLRVACDFKNVEVVRYLLFELGADPNLHDLWGWTALHNTVVMGNVTIVKILLESKSIHVDEPMPRSRRTALHFATEKNHVEIARLLLQAGANKNAKSRRGRTPLDVARRKDLQIMVTLLEGWVFQ